MFDWLVDTLREYPSIPILFTIAVGFWIGKFKYKSFSLGTVTSVLLVGVVVGQLHIPIGEPLKSLFFLLFLFSIGYSCGPQFVAALRGQGIKQVIFAVTLCGLCLGVTLACAKIMGYNAGMATGLFAGAQTISAVIGVGSDTISTLHVSPEQQQQMIDIMPVCYAVTYVFGTIGSAWIIGLLGPKMLGGLDKVRKQTAQLYQQLNHSTVIDDPAFVNGNRPISFRAYKVTAEHFSTPRTVADIEQYFKSKGARLFVERLRQNGDIITPTPQTVVTTGDEIVLSGRHEYIIQDEGWIGPEVDDPQLLTFAAEHVKVMVSKKLNKITVDRLRAQPFMYGVMIKKINRGDVEIPVLAQTQLYHGDMLEIVGLPQEVSAAGPQIGSVERPTAATDLIFVGLAIVIGALVGAVTFNVGQVPVSLSTSGGALISGLFFGWWRTRHPSVGYIPKSSLWLMNNLGLNLFIAVIGIQAGPSFISGFGQVGIMLFVIGMISTGLPLILGIILGDKVFKFHPAINLGCNAGARTTTAALGAVTESLQSSLPALGYTVTYAIGNTLLILMGVAMVLCFV